MFSFVQPFSKNADEGGEDLARFFLEMSRFSKIRLSLVELSNVVVEKEACG